MKILIYRGTQEIGGTCIEVQAENGKKLWIDVGLPLSKINPNTNYVIKESPNSILISHPHQDHYGLIENLNKEIPIYIGGISLALINATKLFTGNPSIDFDFRLFSPWKPFIIENTFHITPFLVDHSSPEAFAFLIEVDGKRIFYTGDFRATGRKNTVYYNLLENPPANIDILFTEGTLISRGKQKYPTEADIEEEIYQTIYQQKNTSFVISSAQNIDRFVSVFKACRRANKKIIIDV